MIEDPKVYKNPDRWAMSLGRLFIERGENWLLDVYEILDVHGGGEIQWRRRDFTVEEMNLWSKGPDDYVMDSQPYHTRELKILQERERTRKANGEESDISWSCKGFNPDSLAPLWPDFEEEHV